MAQNGGRRTKRGANFNLPKLETWLHYTRTIERLGVLLQFTSDITEAAHKRSVKEPCLSTNKKDYYPQICRLLDRLYKIMTFEGFGMVFCDKGSARVQETCTIMSAPPTTRVQDIRSVFPLSTGSMRSNVHAADPSSSFAQDYCTDCYRQL